MAPPAPYERLAITRAEVPVAALIAAGFTLYSADPAGSVEADVLMGQDGRVHAVRLLERNANKMTRRFLLLFAPCALWAQSGWMLPTPPSSVTGIGQSGPVANKPFSGVETRHTTQVLGDGTHVDRSDSSNFFRDAAGRMRSESPERVLIYDAVAKVIYDLDPKHKTYTRHADEATRVSIAVVNGDTYVRSQSGNNISPAPSHVDLGLPARVARGAQTTTEDLAPQVLNGTPVKGSRTTATIPAGTFGNDREVKIVNERWYSDDLQVLVKSTNNDPRFGITTYELNNIVPGPPNPALFQVPGDYREQDRPR